MNIQGENGERCAPARQYPMELAIPPAAHEGVSRALRDAFAITDRDLPGDLRKLLERIE